MDIENAVLFAKATEGCLILELVSQLISDFGATLQVFHGTDDPTVTAIKKSLTHIDIGYHLKAKGLDAWVGFCLQSYRNPNIYMWFSDKKLTRYFPSDLTKTYGDIEEDIQDAGFWIPLHVDKREKLLNPDIRDADKKDILKSFFNAVTNQLP